MSVTSENMTEPHFEDYTILIVDDNPSNLGVLSDYLDEHGLKTRVATDGELALQRAQHIQPDLILLDVIMPGIDGFETCRRLKANDTTKNIPVIFMTALESVEDKVKGFQVGGVDYITKPIQDEEVLARVTTHLHIQDLTLKLQKRNQEIMRLNEQLKDENLRMKSELKVAHRIQQMALPVESELNKIKELDIVAFMEPAADVGGDYYDVLPHNNGDGQIKIAIGDVTGHGLESGVLMLVVQTAVQSLLESGLSDSEQFLNVLNRIIYNSVQRMKTDKNLTLSLLDYKNGRLRVTGQHEEVLVVRQGGKIERIDTFNLGFMIGVVPDTKAFVSHLDIQLQPGDGIVLYTDGITEARNFNKKLYGVERLCEVISQNWHRSAQEIQQAVIADVRQFIGEQKVFDDITLLVLKQQ
ncbi:MAG TPA: response regulator [Thioploca sp.]|nr:MAG: serine/threonine protein phosphatase [Gammaproteobacteria bacterium]HDN27901.1 response regulator [Thioploca sp.]